MYLSFSSHNTLLLYHFIINITYCTTYTYTLCRLSFTRPRTDNTAYRFSEYTIQLFIPMPSLGGDSQRTICCQYIVVVSPNINNPINFLFYYTAALIPTFILFCFSFGQPDHSIAVYPFPGGWIRHYCFHIVLMRI